jgi:hypothetical protein
MAQSALFYSPCWFPFNPSFNPPLLTWNPSYCVVRSRPPWPQVARKLTSPSSNPPSPSPLQIPTTPGQLCTLLRRHRDSGFTGSGTVRMPWIKVLSDDKPAITFEILSILTSMISRIIMIHIEAWSYCELTKRCHPFELILTTLNHSRCCTL